jgi:hypothetical protein
MLASLSRAWELVQALWDSVHIECMGYYSLERLQLLRHYALRSNLFHNSLVIAVMPLPTLFIVLLCDCIPLAAPSAGATANYAYWVRAWIVIAAFTLAVLSHVHYCVRQLPQSWTRILLMTAAIATAHIAIHFALSVTIGFPLPFAYLVMNVPWISLIGVALWLHMGKQCRGDPRVGLGLKKLGTAIYVASSLAVVYPLFYHLFLMLKSDKTGQFLFTPVLPVIKLFEKYLLNHFTKYMEDGQPVMVTFNVEVFNALFVSCCMQNANSLATSVALMVMDFVGATFSLYSLRDLMTHVDGLSAKMGVSRDQMLHVATAIIHANPDILLWRRTPISTIGYPNKDALAGEARRVVDAKASSEPPPNHSPVVRKFPMQRIMTVRHSTVEAFHASAVVPAPPSQTDNGPPVSLAPSSKHPELKQSAVSPPSLPSEVSSAGDDSELAITTRAIERLSLKERKKFVKETLKVLRHTEFLLLVEYTEVIVPIVYCESRSVPLACRTRSPTCSC